VPDVYSMRGGINFNLRKLGFSAGLRDEGVPVHDLLGESNGLRRPGHNLSFEPGIIYKMKRISLICLCTGNYFKKDQARSIRCKSLRNHGRLQNGNGWFRKLFGICRCSI